MELIDIVMKLVGPVEAVGETHADEARYENLNQLIELTDLLLDKIQNASRTAGRHEASMHKVGMCARSFLMQVQQRDVLPQ